MKKLIYSLSILVFMACNGGNDVQDKASASTNVNTAAAKPLKAVVKDKKATLKGTITNFSGNAVQLIRDADVQHMMVENGNFAADVMMADAGFYTVRYGRQMAELFLSPGNDMTLNFNGQQMARTMELTGEGANENNYLASKRKMMNNPKNNISPKDYKLETAAFIEKTKAKYDTFKANLDQVKGNLNPQFVKVEEADLLFAWGLDRVNYPTYHAFYAQKPEFTAPDGYNDFMKDLDIDNVNNFASPNYKNFVKAYINSNLEAEMSKDESLRSAANGSTKAFFNLANSFVKDNRTKAFLMYQALQQHIQYNGADGTQELLSIFNQHNSDPTYKANVEKAYSAWAHLAEGQQAPGWNYIDIEGKQISLADLKGKLVYIDVWATWCGPCKKEIPYLEELQHEYKDNKNVVFASVSLDSNKSAWEKMVTEKNMGGLQLYAGKGANISQDYMIRGIPRFIMVDPAGKIISANAPRPSSDRIKVMLEKLTKKI